MSANIRFLDYGFSTLTAAITDSSTSIAVVSTSGWPALGSGVYAYLTLIDYESVINNTTPPTQVEVVKAIAMTGNVLTVQRGQGTPSYAFAMGDYLTFRVCTPVLDDLASGAAGGAVTSVSAADASVTVTPTTGDVTVKVAAGYVSLAGRTGIYADLTGKPPLAAIAISGSATDLITGTVPAARLPNPGASTLGGVKSLAAVTSNWLTSITTGGLPVASQPDFTDLTGTAAAAQLPFATLAARGTILAKAVVANRFLTGIADGTGVVSAAQPAFTDLSGSVAAGQMPALTGDATSSAGTVATTLATVNSNVGSFTSANITVNAKGLITAAANGTTGTGTVNNGTINQLAYYAATGTAVSGETLLQAVNMPILTGDVNSAGGTLATTVVGLQAGVAAAGKIVSTNIAAPANPAAAHVAIWTDSTDLILKSKNSFGTISTLVNNTQSARTAHNFVTTVNAAGALSYAAPIQADVTGLTTADTPVFAAVSLTTNPAPYQGGYVSGRYYSPMVDLSSTNPVALTLDTLYAVPFPCGQVTAFTKIGFYVQAFTAGNARVGIYNMAGGIPTTLYVDSGTVSVGTNGLKEVSIGIGSVLAQNYCLVILCSVNVSVYGKNSAVLQQMVGTGVIGAQDYVMSSAFAYGALPGTFPAVSYASGDVPNLGLRI